MEHRFASDGDLDRLATCDAQLIADEGHRNAMTVAQLRDRMAGWLAGRYRAVTFWRSIGFRDYSLALEVQQEAADERFGPADASHGPRWVELAFEHRCPDAVRIVRSRAEADAWLAS